MVICNRFVSRSLSSSREGCSELLTLCHFHNSARLRNLIAGPPLLCSEVGSDSDHSYTVCMSLY